MLKEASDFSLQVGAAWGALGGALRKWRGAGRHRDAIPLWGCTAHRDAIPTLLAPVPRRREGSCLGILEPPGSAGGRPGLKAGGATLHCRSGRA